MSDFVSVLEPKSHGGFGFFVMMSFSGYGPKIQLRSRHTLLHVAILRSHGIFTELSMYAVVVVVVDCSDI